MILTTVPLVAIIAILAWGAARSGGNPGGLLINHRVGEIQIEKTESPQFAKINLKGNEFSLSDTIGSIVVVDFWSSWCPPCLKEAPGLERVYRQYRENGVEFIGIAIWDQQRNVVKYVERFDITYPNIIDEGGLIAIDFGVRGIPEKFFIDRQGQIVRKIVGPLKEDYLREILDNMLAE
jgi:cytochrome c biogenesis protein CcmG/thiol:disulfide interchange protein DsbE